MGTSILQSARERWEQGYVFALDGELDTDQHTLFEQLKEKNNSWPVGDVTRKGKISIG